MDLVQIAQHAEDLDRATSSGPPGPAFRGGTLAGPVEQRLR